MKILAAVVAATVANLGASAAETPAVKPAGPSDDEPMAVFAALDGKSFRAEWSDENGTFVDVATYDMILNGRALQSTHRVEGTGYGGRTIFFWDEGARKYIYHYFTTGGFHTLGSADFVDGVMVTEEQVEGHDKIATVRSKSTFGPEEITVDIVYVGKDGTQTAAPKRIYKPVADPGRLFADTE